MLIKAILSMGRNKALVFKLRKILNTKENGKIIRNMGGVKRL